MKKITLLFFALFIGMTFGNAQEFNNLQDYVNAGGSAVINNNNSQPTIYSRSTEETTLFTTLADFSSNCDVDSLVFEDFTGGPSTLFSCDVVTSSAGGACYAAGELEEGFEITTSGADIGNTTLYLDPSDGFGNPDPAFGSNSFADATIINFTDPDGVTSFSFELYALIDGGIVNMRIFNENGEMESVDIDVTSTGPVFVGGISDTAIVSIELEDLTGANAELISNLRFGNCGAILTDEPEDALALTVGGMFGDFPRDVDNTEATASAEAMPSCGDFQGGDSWYTVTVPSTGAVTIETGMVADSDVNDTALAVYEGTIDALMEIACDEDGSDMGMGNFSLITVMDRTPGEVLYIRVFESGNDVTGLYQIAAYADCAVSAPEIFIAGSDLVEVSVCVGDGEEDFVDVDQTGGLDVGIEGWVIARNDDGTILGLPAEPPFEFDGIEAGVCAIYNIRYNDGITGLEVDGNIGDLEGCFELSNPILVDRVSEGGVCDTCEFVLEMSDSFGDGWNGATIDIIVDGIVALDDATLDNGALGTLPFTNVNEAEITVVVGSEGTFPEEVSYRILDNVGQEIAVGDLTTVPEAFRGFCLDCLLPEVEIAIIPLCDQGEFIVTLLTSSLSESTQYTVTNDVTGDEIIIDSLGSMDYGPFSIDTAPFTISVIPDDAACTITFDVAETGCPPVNDNCMGALGISDGVTSIANTDLAAIDDVPNCGQDAASLGIWYFINDGGTAIDVTIDTFGSGYDTYLAYYTGSCDALICEGNNDDAGGLLQSEINFNTGGTGENIYILATGFGTNTGDLILNVTADGLLSTGEESFVDGDITLFPNPAINDLTISSREMIENVSVYNLSGQVVLQKSVNATQDLLDVSNLTSGVYLMQLTSNGQSVTKKFIKR